MTVDTNLTPDLDDRVEKLAARLGLAGEGRKAAVIEQALTALEERVVPPHAGSEGVAADIDRYIEDGVRLRERLRGKYGSDDDRPLSLLLQQELYDERGIPK